MKIKRYSLFLLFMMALIHFANAQRDTTFHQVVFGTNVQHTYNPSLTALLGRYVVRTDLMVHQQNGAPNSHLTWLDGYHTQLGRHGIGAVLHYIGNSTYNNWIYGLQYAYNFKPSKNKVFWKNTNISLGTQLGVISTQSNSQILLYGDQIEDQYGFVFPTTEKRNDNIFIAPSINIGFTLQSNRVYLTSQFQNIQNIDLNQVGYYLLPLQSHHWGFKAIQYKKVQFWGTGSIVKSAINPTPLFSFGPSLAYKTFAFTYNYHLINQHHIRLGYFHQNFRAYAEWIPIPSTEANIFKVGIAQSFNFLKR